MRKSLLNAFLIALMISGLAFIGSAHFTSAQSRTNVSGIISSDTTWTQANSPYGLTGPVAVNIGVTLTIEAGTTVLLGSNYIQVNGTLVAIGNTTNAIIFNGGTINFEQSSNSWNEQTQTGCIIDYAVSSCSIDIYNASPLISNSQFSYPADYFEVSGGITVNGGSPFILNNKCDGPISVYDEGLAIISKNTIDGAGGGVGCYSQNCDVIDNTFSGCQYAITTGGAATMGATIEGNLLYQGNVAIYCGPGPAIIQNNTIANNTLGIQMPYSSSSKIIYNNIQNNQLSISLIDTISNKLDSNNVNATYNWWGTTDQQAINQTIYDSKDNFNLGTVDFVPFLTIPNPEAPTYTPTPTQSPSPFPTSTSTSTPTSTTSPSPSPSASQPQQPISSLTVELIVAVMAIVIVAVAIAAFVLGKKSGRKQPLHDDFSI
jgi:hypothetical protein